MLGVTSFSFSLQSDLGEEGVQQQIRRGHFRIISDSGVVSFDDFERSVATW